MTRKKKDASRCDWNTWISTSTATHFIYPGWIQECWDSACCDVVIYLNWKNFNIITKEHLFSFRCDVISIFIIFVLLIVTLLFYTSCFLGSTSYLILTTPPPQVMSPVLSYQLLPTTSLKWNIIQLDLLLSKFITSDLVIDGKHAHVSNLCFWARCWN